MITEINIVAPPHTNYTSPVQRVAIFLSMREEGLVDRIDKYLEMSPIGHLFTRQRPTPPAERELVSAGAELARRKASERNTWELYKSELAPEPGQDSTVARYHLCHPNYKPDPQTYAQVLDIGSLHMRLRTISGPSDGGVSERFPNPSPSEDGPCDYSRENRFAASFATPSLTTTDDGDYSLSHTQGISSESHVLLTHVSDNKWAATGPLEPIALATIPRSSVYRHMRIRFSDPIQGRFLAVRFSNESAQTAANVDIESFTVRGTGGHSGASVSFV